MGQASEILPVIFSKVKSGFQPASWRSLNRGGSQNGVCRWAVAFSKERPVLFHNGHTLFPKADFLVVMMGFLSLSPLLRPAPEGGRPRGGLGERLGLCEKSLRPTWELPQT